MLPNLFVFGKPGSVGGASTKIIDLVGLLSQDFEITIVSDIGVINNQDICRALGSANSRAKFAQWKSLSERLTGVGLAVCEADFFDRKAKDLKARGLRIVWSNEMMWPLKGEEQAASSGLIDRVLFVSEHQSRAFHSIYENVPKYLTGNYINASKYPWRERKNERFTVGRLSRPDVFKYPLDFPVFYEEMELAEARYRIMAWSAELQKQYRWHRFGPQWELFPAGKQSAAAFLDSLDIFLYPLGHRVKESWGRAVVEAMLTGAVPVVPAGHHFDKLMVHGESGFICKEFREFKAVVRELYENCPLRMKISRQAAAYAREHLCNPEEHRKKWIEALTF